ncbi:TonB-dependent receptor [Sphingomonas sp. BIUV-7]|uniref:TonB-dependent receptor n=1 Tax=Sphingomonas natans TaxID=3063330 RepID=A0ABT8YA93_9SPHN|nr:TonB-dependent receptor [Sphingomonas sp. BIUV-7]MDO6414912.1 TonB-dependent receptor [Sphingomonas sp. BIUV-7]
MMLASIAAIGAGLDAAAAQSMSEPVITAPKSTPAEGETINTAGGKPGVTTERMSLAPGEEPSPANEGEITVTGTRIVRDGYSAPTPVSVISTEEINREAPANINDFVNTLPAVRGSATAASSNGALSNGQAGVATVNLRNLGANRTLVLLDGQRSVASTTDGTVDVNTIPQSLIQRVEVVTGGASSAYGSDAVSGVINFILDKEYKGLKAEYEYGVTTYGDGSNHKASLTGGMSFGEGRGHILASGEYFHQQGIQTIDRDWNDSGFFQINNPAYSAAACTDNNAATVCTSEYLIRSGVGSGNFTPGGLIVGAKNAAGTVLALTNATLPVAVRTALTNTYFGTIDPSTGRATTGTLAVGPRGGQWMVGGDYKYASSSHVGSATLLPSEDRRGAFGRASWEFAPWLKVFGQFGYSSYRGLSYYQLTPSQTTTTGPGASTTSGVEIFSGNPYLPTAIQTLLTTNNLQSIVISTGNAGLPAQGSDMNRKVYRYVAGADGDFTLAERDFHWSGYYQKGITKTHELLVNAWNYDRMTKATNAVRAADGTIRCAINADASTANDDPLCFPLNRIGVGGMDPRAIDYVLGNGRQPARDQKITQDIGAITFSTNNLFEVWAGPVSIAFGGEARKEKVSGFVDPFFAPQGAGSTIVPTWRYGNFLPVFGSYNVKEAFLETVIPIIKNMDFNGAVRVTDYSTSGRVETWKTGLTYQPIPDVKFRGTISRDIRAPNLGELFNPGGGATNSVTRPIVPGGANSLSDTYINSVVGNTDLKPEIAKTYGAGAVFTPTFLPGFAASVDYYKIKLTGAISTYSAQNLVDLCYGNQQDAASCAFINLATGGAATSGNPNVDIQSITIKPLNFVGIKNEGVDIEASYRRHIGPGTVSLRALTTRAITNESDNGISLVNNTVGQNSGSLPKWTFRFTAAYNLDNGLSFQAVARGITSGTYNNSYVVCDTNCPVSTSDNRTVNYNHINGAWYFDVNGEYKFTAMSTKAAVFFSIRNLLNKDPVLVANGPNGDNTEAYPQTNRIYDVLGRVFRVGVRIDY